MRKTANLAIPVALLLAASTAVLTSGCGRKGQAEEAAAASAADVTATVAAVQRVPFAQEEELPGTVAAVQHADISPKVMSHVAAVYVREGDHVKKGQVLARLEAADLAASVGQASAGVLNAQASYQQAKTALTMQRTQSQVQVEQAQAALEQAKAQLAKAKQGPRPEQVRQAEQAEQQAKAAYEQAQAYLDMAKEGARAQVKRQAQQGVIVAQQQVTQAEAGLATARANQQTVQSDYDRMKNLYDQDIIPRQRLDHVALQLETAKQAVRQAQAAVEQANAGLKIAREQQSMADEGPRTQEVIAAQKQVDQAKAGYEQAKQEALMAHQGGRWEDIKAAEEGVKQAEQALRAAKAAQARDQVSEEDVKRAAAGITQARAGLSGAQTMLGYAEIRAPFSGVITRRSADPGDMAMPQAPILSMDDDSLYQLVCDVPENVAATITQRAQVTVSLQAISLDVPAHITQVVPSADPASRTLTVKVNLPRLSTLKSGLFGRLRIATGHGTRLVMPQGAVVERNGLTGVFTVDRDDSARYTLVKVGKADGDLVQVLSGLRDGQRVVTDHLDEIEDGVRVVTEERR